jgi:hypothetical protein
LAITASALLVGGAAVAQQPASGPAEATKATNAAPADAKDKAQADKAPPPEKADETTAAAKRDERAERAKKEREALRPEVEKALKGSPMSEAMKRELERHARRMARIDRVKAVATEAKDDPSAERAAKLAERETARHSAWMTNYDPKTQQKVGAK